ncbi:MAG: TerB N-terminal domain-containing protein [Planctomycetaceae bacterium]|nr:TerB N-terminal domain-containing protein [Planctomycetaceae bacterium]
MTDPINHSDLVEIQSPSRVDPQTHQRQKANQFSNWVKGVSASDIEFYSAGQTIKVHGRTIDNPLLYKVEGQLREPFDASLIETALPVAQKARGAEGLPYWPSYRGCTPRQRCRYLNWLQGGRSNPDIELGYVFIHFYGMERRVILDRKDHEPIVEEILRLLALYGHSRSFQRYAGSLLWVALLTAPMADEWPDETLEAAMEATAYWDDDNLAAMLALYHGRGGHLPVRAALIVAQHDPRSPRSVVINRQREHFEELFYRRFAEMSDKGLSLRTAKREYRLQYRPASQSLMEHQGRHASIDITFPNVLGIPSQFKPLLEIWSSTIDDLRGFDRAMKKSDGQSMTAEMYEALPEELRVDDHPDFDVWYDTIQKHADDEGWALVPAGDLARLRGVSERSRLTKKQSEDLAATAAYMDLCIEPDARESGQSYRWNEFVSVFPREEDGPENLKSYHAASILLRLGMTIATADGDLDESEQEFITRHLEEQFDLTPQESVRLEHLAHLLSHSSTNDAKLAKKLRELPENERQIVGHFLIGIAATDGIITRDEVMTLRKLFKSLNLPLGSIDELTVGKVQVAGRDQDATGELVLDQDAIQRIMRETAQVADFLQSVMVDEEDEPLPSKNVSEEPEAAENKHRTIPDGTVPEACTLHEESTHQSFPGLDRRYHGFLNALLTQDDWEREDLESLARSHRLMAGACIEAVNEWSLDALGDWLIDDAADPIHIEQALITSLK